METTRLVIIEIPHQRKARARFYATIDQLLNDYYDADPGGELSGDVDAMARFIADDWNGYMLLDATDDLDQIDNYTGHQQYAVRAMREEIEEFFAA